MDLILLGHPDTKRTQYFLKAAHDLREPITLVPLPSMILSKEADFDFSLLKNCVVKVDPPPPIAYPIDCQGSVMNRYHAFLCELQRTPGIKLLNSSAAIWNTMDKATCKQMLQKKGLPTTSALTDADGFPVRIHALDELRETMIAKGIHQVFIKPRLGSGAAGIVAFRLNFKTGAAIMETSSFLSKNRLYNTNRLRKTGNLSEITQIINHVLAQDTLVETWIPKASYAGKAFDLRAVFQFGRLEFLVARQSNGTITNLHLNNNALAVTDLALSPSLLLDIETLCREGVALFPGLNVAGLDILLRQHTLIPLIIEINGQGDLIYQDIFAENRIYKAQIRAMKSLNSS